MDGARIKSYLKQRGAARVLLLPTSKFLNMHSTLQSAQFLFTSILLCILFALPGIAQSEFQYIDDENGDSLSGALPSYEPGSAWAQGAGCNGCGFTPDPQQAYLRTWHDTTHHTTDPTRSVQFNFTGSSLDVYCILPNPTDPTLTSTYNLTFSLDGHSLPQVFTHISDNSSNYLYNHTVLSLANLAEQRHVFIMQAASMVVNSTILFDYARYSISSASPTHTKSRIPTIIGAVVGPVASILVIIVIMLIYRRCHKHGRPLPLLGHSADGPVMDEYNPSVESPEAAIRPVRNVHLGTVTTYRVDRQPELPPPYTPEETLTTSHGPLEAQITATSDSFRRPRATHKQLAKPLRQFFSNNA